MTTYQMEIFIKVAEYNSYTIAAKQLYTSQSNISKVIKSLEDELNVKLFTRAGTSNILTKAGKLVLESCKFMLLEQQHLKNELLPYNRNNKEILSLALSTSLSYARLLEPINKFKNIYPEITLSIAECTSDKFASMLDIGECDVAIGWKSDNEYKHYQCIPLYKDRWNLLVSADNELSNFDIIDIKQAKNETFVMQYNQKRFVLFCKQNGFLPHIQHHADTMQSLANLVRNNYGVAFFSNKMFPADLIDHVKLIQLRQNFPNELAIITRKENHSLLVQQFTDFYLKEYHAFG